MSCGYRTDARLLDRDIPKLMLVCQSQGRDAKPMADDSSATVGAVVA